jgi:hypothetical protein
MSEQPASVSKRDIQFKGQKVLTGNHKKKYAESRIIIGANLITSLVIKLFIYII